MRLTRATGRTPRHRRRRRATVLTTVLATLTAMLAGALFTAGPAQAQTGFHEVENFGSNPGNLRMFAYVPENARSGAPVVVLFHACGGSAQDLDVHTGWRKYADLYGFTIVFPEQKPENVGSGGPVPHTCFSAWNPVDRTHDGEGEARSVVQMVEYMETTHDTDPNRVYVTGYSGGGAATNVMLAAYPDVFSAGAVFFGMAYGCADSEEEYFQIGPTAPCPGETNALTPQEWGDKIRDAYPGYTGDRPRVQIWHGGSDPLINVNSLEKQRDGWTDVFGLPQTPTATSQPAPGVTKEVYGSGQVETYLVDAMGHEPPIAPGDGLENCGTPGSGHESICGAYHAARFFGLDG